MQFNSIQRCSQVSVSVSVSVSVLVLVLCVRGSNLSQKRFVTTTQNKQKQDKEIGDKRTILALHDIAFLVLYSLRLVALDCIKLRVEICNVIYATIFSASIKSLSIAFVWRPTLQVCAKSNLTKQIRINKQTKTRSCEKRLSN